MMRRGRGWWSKGRYRVFVVGLSLALPLLTSKQLSSLFVSLLTTLYKDIVASIYTIGY